MDIDKLKQTFQNIAFAEGQKVVDNYENSKAAERERLFRELKEIKTMIHGLAISICTPEQAVVFEKYLADAESHS